MARALSSQQSLRRSMRRAERNKVRRTQIKTAIRRVADAIAAHDAAAAEKAYREAAGVLDRNANRLTIHPNTAARRKSRLARQVSAMGTGAK